MASVFSPVDLHLLAGLFYKHSVPVADRCLLWTSHCTKSLGNMAPALRELVLLQGESEAGVRKKIWVAHKGVS